jgi:hypothetical protein
MISRLKRQRALLIPLLVLLLAGGWLVLRSQTKDTTLKDTSRASFIETCKQQGRLANGGGQLRMDDATEEGLDLYCACVADHFDQALNPDEINAVGAGTASPETVTKLNGVVTSCQAQHLLPKSGSDPASGATPPVDPD